MYLGSRRNTFSNLTPKLKTLVSRWKRGVYRADQRGDITPIRDDRGPVVREIAIPQTFLKDAEVDRLVDDYLAGSTVRELAQKYEIHRGTVSRHLTNRGVARRLPGLDVEDAAEAVKLCRGGSSMRSISRTLGVDRKVVRASLLSAGVLTA